MIHKIMCEGPHLRKMIFFAVPLMLSGILQRMFLMGLSVGVNILVSRYCGAGKKKDLDESVLSFPVNWSG